MFFFLVCPSLIFAPGYLLNQFILYTDSRDLRGIKMLCFARGVSSSTIAFRAIIAEERWLHMSLRSLLTVSRVVILFITSAVLLFVFSVCYLRILYSIGS